MTFTFVFFSNCIFGKSPSIASFSLKRVLNIHTLVAAQCCIVLLLRLFFQKEEKITYHCVELR